MADAETYADMPPLEHCDDAPKASGAPATLESALNQDSALVLTMAAAIFSKKATVEYAASNLAETLGDASRVAASMVEDDMVIGFSAEGNELTLFCADGTQRVILFVAKPDE